MDKKIFHATRLGDNMRHLLLKLSTGFCVALWALTTAAAEAQSQPAAKVFPDSVRTRNMPDPVKLTLDAAPDKAKDLTNAASILVGGEKITPNTKESFSVTFSPPRRETAGEVEVKALNAQDDVLARGRMAYVDSGHPINRQMLAFFYALVILAFPFILMLYDLTKAYKYAHETRRSIIDKTASDGLTLEELKLLLNELSQSPPGIPGLARNSIAFMLMMILAVAIVHILAVDPPGTKDIPVSIDRILVLLTGLLTSVVSFYFGSRAAESAAQQAANAASSSDTGSKPQPITFVPKSGKPKDSVTISGAGFGTEKGSVSFGDDAADMAAAKWTDREVIVSVPVAAKPAKVRVILIPKGTDRKLISAAEFDILADATVPGSVNNENDIDGCDVAVTVATPDKDLPAAEGGVQK